MAFDKYGGYVWSDQPHKPENDPRRRGLGLAAAVAVGGGALWVGTKALGDDTRLIDTAYHAARLIGDQSPFSILNTFRAPEWMSPFISPVAQGLVRESGELGEGVFTHRWKVDFKDKSTAEAYLGKITGLNPTELGQRGIGSPASTSASELLFRRTNKSSVGSLYSIVDGKEVELSKNVSLFQSTLDDVSPLHSEKKINRAFHAVLQALGITEQHGFGSTAEKQFFESVTGGAPQYIPVPSVQGPIKDLGLRTATLRAPFAFAMERANILLEGVTNQIPFVSDVAKGLEKIAGANLRVKSGPALKMFARFGILGGVATAAVGGAAQLDWIRRNYDGPGQIVASAAFAGVAAAAAHKLGKSPRLSIAVGIASFFGQLVLPGFKEGIVPGIATTYTNATLLKAHISPFSTYRQTLEGFAPGITSWQTGALLGVGTLLAASSPWGLSLGADRTIPSAILNSVGRGFFGLPETVETKDADGNPKTLQVDTPKTTRQVFNPRARQSFDEWAAKRGFVGTPKEFLRTRFLDKTAKFGGLSGVNELMSGLNQAWAASEEVVKTNTANNPLNISLQDKIEKIEVKYSGKTDWGSVGLKHLQKAKETIVHSFFGADAVERKFAEKVGELGVNPKLGRWAALFAGAFVAHGLVSGGLLGSMKSAGELQAEYEGRKLVEVRQGRFWEGGGTPYAGNGISYFRPSSYHLMMNRVRQKGIWGPDEDEISPLKKFYLENFTYELEKFNYYDRPYPVTSGAFQNLPIVGPILAATVGKIIKPAKLMHTSEWSRENEQGNVEFADVYKGWRQEPSYDLGATKPGIPTTPLSPFRLLGQAQSQARELAGLPGWASSVVWDLTTGEPGFGGGQPYLASAADMTSPARMFWEADLGGMGFSNEVLRRFLPNEFGTGEKQNPVLNSMPSWLPEKFHYGDPYRAIAWGEARLPGSGYEQLHPELRGLDPEAYPLAYKHSILSDVALHSEELRRVRDGLYSKRQQGLTTESENQMMDYTDRLAAQKMAGHQYNKVDPGAIQLPGSGITQALSGRLKQNIRDVVAPAEYLVPMGFRPVQKLMGDDRTPIEQYEYERLYGTKLAFWDEPTRDWFRPALYSAAHLMGFEGKPGWRKDADNTNEYFDRLEFAKWMRISQQAEMTGDRGGQLHAQYMASGTRYGVNPQGNPLSMYWSLPEDERPFFNAFAQAQGSERSRILEMIPGDQQRLYQAIWDRADQGGDSRMFPGSKTQVDNEHLSKRFYELQGEMQGSVPREDWIGWNQEVELGDIKALYVDQLGRDLHDYGMWESQLNTANRQPYLEGSTEAVSPDPTLSQMALRGAFYDDLRGSIEPSQLEVNSMGGSQAGNYAKLTWNDDRHSTILDRLRSTLEF